MSIKSSLKKIVEALGGSVTGKSIPGLLKDIIKANGGEPKGKNIPDLLGDISENVSGGGSDFEIVKLKIVNNSDDPIYFSGPFFQEQYESTTGRVRVRENSEQTFDVIFRIGGATVYFETEKNYVTDESIQAMTESGNTVVALVNGDGTITIKRT